MTGSSQSTGYSWAARCIGCNRCIRCSRCMRCFRCFRLIKCIMCIKWIRCCSNERWIQNKWIVCLFHCHQVSKSGCKDWKALCQHLQHPQQVVSVCTGSLGKKCPQPTSPRSGPMKTMARENLVGKLKHKNLWLLWLFFFSINFMAGNPHECYYAIPLMLLLSCFFPHN